MCKLQFKAELIFLRVSKDGLADIDSILEIMA